MDKINYAPRVLRNLREICEAMGVGRELVRKWVLQGAPIAVEGSGKKTRYSAELAALQAWRLIHARSTVPRETR